MDECELLKRYVAAGSEEAFRLRARRMIWAFTLLEVLVVIAIIGVAWKSSLPEFF